MTRARLIELLQDLPGDTDDEVKIEIGDLVAEITDVYEDPAYGVVFVAGEEAE